MDLSFVKFIQKASCDFLDGLFSFITVIGETSMFFMMFVAIYLCYRKEFAIKYFFTFVLAGLINGALKSVIARPRPYTNEGVLDVRHTTGYSFPSGHSQNYALQSTLIGTEFCKNDKNKKHRLGLIIPLIVGGLIVGFSRIYLGQHYLTDVFVGLILGTVLALGFDVIYTAISKTKAKKFFSTRSILLMTIPVILLLIVLVEYFNLGSASMLNVFYTYLAIYIGILVGYNIDRSFIGYQEKDVWYIQLIKIAIACIGVAMISYAFDWIKDEVVRNFSFYLSATLYVTAFLPFIFKLVFNNRYNKLNSKNSETENKEEVKE